MWPQLSPLGQGRGISSGCPMTGPAPARLTRPSPGSWTLTVAVAPFPVVWAVVACHAAWPRGRLLPGLASPRWPRRPESPVGQPREPDSISGSELTLVLEHPGLRPETLVAHPSGAGSLRGRRRWTTYYLRRTAEARAGGQLRTALRPPPPCLPRPAVGRGRHLDLAHRAQVGLLVPSSWKRAAQAGGSGGWEGRELQEPSAHARPEVRAHPRQESCGRAGLPGNWARGPTGCSSQPPPPIQTPYPEAGVPGPTPNCPIKGRQPFNSTGNLWED